MIRSLLLLALLVVSLPALVWFKSEPSTAPVSRTETETNGTLASEELEEPAPADPPSDTLEEALPPPPPSPPLPPVTREELERARLAVDDFLRALQKVVAE